MKRFLALVFVSSLLALPGCGTAENTVIDKEDLAQYDIPPGEMEKAMKKAMQSTKTKK